MAVPARVRDGAEQPLRLRELLARLPVERLADGARETPRPAAEDLVGRGRLSLADGAQQDADAGRPVLLPRRRLGDERDEVVEVGALDRRRDAVGERRHAQAPVGVLGGADGEEGLERALPRASLGELARELGALVEPDLAPGDGRPEALLVVVEEARVDALPLPLDHGEPARHVLRHRHEPRGRREAAPGAAGGAAAGRRRDAGTLTVEVGVEQRVERDDALGVGGALRDEVDDDARLLARVRAHDPADPLLVDPLGRGGREVHADGGARRVPALGEELRVDQDVDLAALVGGERLGELARRRPARDGHRLEARRAELLGEVVGMVDTGRVDDPGRRSEAIPVEARRGLVERDVVEGCGECALLEVAAHDGHRVDGRDGRDAQ